MAGVGPLNRPSLMEELLRGLAQRWVGNLGGGQTLAGVIEELGVSVRSIEQEFELLLLPIARVGEPERVGGEPGRIGVVGGPVGVVTCV